VKKPRFAAHERGLLVALAHFVPQWRDVVLLVRPETILRWHRAGFRLFWRAKSTVRARGMPTRRTPSETVELIRRLAQENPLWGAERIRGELLKLGVQRSPGSTSWIERYVAWFPVVTRSRRLCPADPCRDPGSTVLPLPVGVHFRDGVGFPRPRTATAPRLGIHFRFASGGSTSHTMRHCSTVEASSLAPGSRCTRRN
jgi:hypothetical protein